MSYPLSVIRLISLISLISLIGEAPAHAGDVQDTLRYNLTPVPLVATPPKIDGVVDKREWYGASLVPRLILAQKGVAADARSRVYLSHDATNLHVAFQFDRPENALVPQPGDLFEMFLDPAHDHKAAVAFAGTVAGPVSGKDWQYHARNTDFGWEGEMAIPFAALGRNAPVDGEAWGFDFINHQMTPIEQVAGYSFGSKKGDAAQLSHIRFVKSAPPMRFEQFGQFWSEQGGGGVLEIANASDQPANLAVTMELLKRKPDAKGSYLPGIVGGLQDGVDIVLASPKELIAQEMAKFQPVTSTNATIALPANRRAAVRVAENEIGEYLLKYRIARGDQAIGGGVLPFVLSPPIQLTLTPYHLSPGVISVKTDLRRAKEWDKGAKAVFALARKAGDKSLAEVAREFDGARELTVALPTRQAEAGGYLVTLDLFGADGKKVGSVSEGFTKPPVPDWFTKRVGYEPLIPPPWKPIKAGGKSVSFLMGEYEPGELALPAQVNVRSIYEEKRVPLLSEPIALKGKVNGKEIVWSKSKGRLTGRKPEAVEYESEASFEGLTIVAKTEFEFDGMAKVTLTLLPVAANVSSRTGASDATSDPRSGERGYPSIDSLCLEFPMTKEFSTLYLRGPAADAMKTFMAAGAVPKEGIRHEFVHSVWLGNEERGFRWFSENMRGWHVGRSFREQAIEVIPSETGTVLRLNLFKDDKPFPITKEREIVLGYMFTPNKPITDKPLAHGLVHEKMAQTEGSFMNSGEIWFFPLQGWPIIPEPTTEAELQKAREADKYGNWSDIKRNEMRAAVALGQKYGARVVPYSGWMLPYESREYKVRGDEMIATPLRGMGCGCNVCCWNTPMTDVYTALMADRIRDLDINGFRMDSGYSAETCEDLNHAGYGSVCGWFDDGGKLQPSRGIFAAREAAKRARRIFHGGVRTEDGLTLHHIHYGNRYDPILGMMDGVVSAEGGEMNMKSLSEFPLDFFRANVMGDAHGWQVSYMAKTPVIGYDCRYGLCLLHNFSPRGGHMMLDVADTSYGRAANVPTPIWMAREWIRPFEKGTELWGYWKNAKYLDTGHPEVQGTFHVRRGEKLLLGMLNKSRQPVATTVRLDLKALGFKGKVYAYEPHARAELPVDGDKLNLTFTPEGYRMVMIASKPFDYYKPERTGENLVPEIAPGQWPKEGLPAGWEAHTSVGKTNVQKPTATNLRVENGSIVLQSDGSLDVRLRKRLAVEKGRSYLLEVDAYVDCEDKTFVGVSPDLSYFRLALGELYFADVATLTSQAVPGHVNKLRLWFTVHDYAHIDLWLRGSKGKAIIQRVELYELKNVPRRPWVLGK